MYKHLGSRALSCFALRLVSPDVLSDLALATTEADWRRWDFFAFRMRASICRSITTTSSSRFLSLAQTSHPLDRSCCLSALALATAEVALAGRIEVRFIWCLILGSLIAWANITYMV